MKQLFKYLVIVLSIFGFVNTMGMPVSAHEGHDGPHEEEVLEYNNLEACGFPGEYETLLSYSREDAVWPELQDAPLELAMPIPTGSYSISALSFDSHSTKHNPTQANERWQFWAYGSDMSTPIFYSRYTDDIPDDQDYTTSMVQSYVYFDEPVYYIRYVHYAYSNGLEDMNFGGRAYDSLTQEEKNTVVWNSVTPSCIFFEPVSQVTCEGLLVTANESEKGTYTVSLQVENTSELPIQTTFYFGDGSQTTTNGFIAQHTYKKNGTFTVTAEIKHDGSVIDSCSKNATISTVPGTVLGTVTDTTTSTATAGTAVTGILQGK